MISYVINVCKLSDKYENFPTLEYYPIKCNEWPTVSLPTPMKLSSRPKYRVTSKETMIIGE